MKIFATLVLLILNLICLPVSFAEHELPPPDFFILLQNLATGNDAKDIDQIKQVSRYPYEETSAALMSRLFLENTRTQSTGNLNKKLYLVLLKAIGKHTDASGLPSIQKFTKEFDLIASAIDDEVTHKEKITPIAEMVLEVAGQIALRNKPLPKAIDVMVQKQGLILPEAVHFINPGHESGAKSGSVLNAEGHVVTKAQPTEAPVAPVAPTEVVAAEPQNLDLFFDAGLPTLPPSDQVVAVPQPEVQPSVPPTGFVTPMTGTLEGISKFIAVPTTEEKKELGASTQEAKSAKKRDFRSAMEHLEFVRKYLELHVVGQPEAVNSFVGLERENLFMGRQGKRMLMGLPGTGKDTLAKEFTNAINNGDENAFEKHMFRVPTVNGRLELSKVQGSATGVMGSNHLSPFILFLVNHSGGRYITEKVQEGYSTTMRVLVNPEWKGEDLQGYDRADQAVLYVDRLHLWTREAKDHVFLDGAKEGRFKIGNPAGGEQEIIVPVKMVFATAEGSALLASRELNGQRYGEPQSVPQLVNNWELTHHDHERLKNEARRTSGAVNAGGTSETVGTSEALLSLFGEGEILLLRPLTEQDIKDIVQKKLEFLAKQLKNPESILGEVKLKWSPELVEFISAFHYFAEENANPMEIRVANMVQQTLLDAIEAKQIEGSKESQAWTLDIRRNKDKTYSLLVDVERSGKKKNLVLPIAATESERSRNPISDKEIDHILSKESWMSSQVFGVDHIIKRLMINYLVSEEGRNRKVEWHEATAPAQTYMLLGLSSTGKTELSKVLSEAQYEKRTAIKTISFNGIQTSEQMREMFFGKKDEKGNPIPSDFMKEYDRNNGRMLFVFDETSNTPMHVLKELYDILREPVVTLFSDNKPRPMGGITIVATGNAGEEWMTNIPRDIPSDQQLAAMQMMYEMAMNDPDAQRALLEKYFPAALINRVGESNIFFFGPLTFQSIRSLTQLKLGQAFERLKPDAAQRGWHIQFESKEDYVKLVEMIEDIGFILHEQGASIDRFVKQDFEKLVHFHLLKEKIPTNAKVTVKLTRLDDIIKEATKKAAYRIDLITDKKTISINYEGRAVTIHANIPVENRLLTAIHEAGHELTREIFFREFSKPLKISIIPGVIKILNRWVYYGGIASNVDVTSLRETRQYMLFEMASLFAGEVAETLVTKNQAHSGGKASDMMRATKIARHAILHLGLSEKFGRMTIPKDADMDKEVSLFSDERRNLLDAEVQAMLVEARELAKTVLSANLERVLIPLGQELFRKGIMETDEILAFYKTHKVDYAVRSSPLRSIVLGVKDRLARLRKTADSLEVQFNSNVSIPEDGADIAEITKDMKRKAILDIPIPHNIPLKTSECEDVLRLLDRAL